MLESSKSLFYSISEGFHTYPGIGPPGIITIGGYIFPKLVYPRMTVNLLFSFLPPPAFEIGTLLVPLKS